MVTRLVLFMFFCSASNIVIAQNHIFENISLLSSSINSEGNEIAPIMSPEGNLLFFARSQMSTNTGGYYGGQDIWMSEHLESGWRRATNLYGHFNTKSNETVIGFNKSGTVLYFTRTDARRKVKGVYRSQRIKGEWRPGELIPIEGIETIGSLGFFMHPDEDILLISANSKSSKGLEDIYVCERKSDGTWTSPKNLGSTINTSGFEISPFLSDDKRRLYFSSNGHKGFGDADIFVSQRLYDSWETWTVPVNLGERINSKNFEAYFSIYGDSLAYFSAGSDGKDLNLYSVDVAITNQPNRKLRPLSQEDVKNLIGDDVNRKIVFGEGSSSIEEMQVELLWFIAHRLVGNKEVSILLVHSPLDDDDITLARERSIITKLVGGGLEGSRIDVTETGATDSMPQKGEIHIVFAK